MPRPKSRNRPAAPPVRPSAVVYCRVSTRGQAVDGVGLAAQESVCRAHAERHGWAVLGAFRDEGRSGKDAVEDRPGLTEAIGLVRSTPGAVLVAYSVARVARRQKVLWHVLDDRDGLGVPFSSATEPFDTSTPMGKAMLGMLAVWSQLEADLVAERTRDALAEVRAQGKVLGQRSIADIGLPAETLQLIREQRAKGATVRALAEELNRRGIPTATGRGKWHPRTVLVAEQIAREQLAAEQSR